MEKNNHNFKPGDKVTLNPNCGLTPDQEEDARKDRPELFSLPFITVKEVSSTGFNYEESGRTLMVKSEFFILASAISWEERSPEEKKQFIKRIVGSLYTDRHMYSRIEQLIKTHEHRTT